MKRSHKVVGIVAFSVLGFVVVFGLYVLIAAKVINHHYVVDLANSHEFTIFLEIASNFSLAWLMAVRFGPWV